MKTRRQFLQAAASTAAIASLPSALAQEEAAAAEPGFVALFDGKTLKGWHKNPKRITSWINGEKVCDFDGATYAGPGYDKEQVLKTLGREGSIAVQVHGGGGWPKDAKCRWRNLRIKKL